MENSVSYTFVVVACDASDAAAASAVDSDRMKGWCGRDTFNELLNRI